MIRKFFRLKTSTLPFLSPNLEDNRYVFASVFAHTYYSLSVAKCTFSYCLINTN